MFEIVERSFIEQDKVICKYKTIDEAIKRFNDLMTSYLSVLYDTDVQEYEQTSGYILLEHIQHKFGLIKLGIREV